MYFVYVLRSKKLNKRYDGSFKVTENRLVEHNRGCNKFATKGIPWIKIQQEDFATKREKFLKSGQ